MELGKWLKLLCLEFCECAYEIAQISAHGIPVFCPFMSQAVLVLPRTSARWPLSAVAHLGMTFWWKTTLRLQYSNDVDSFIRNKTQVILDYFCSIPERILGNSFKTKQKTCRTRKYLVPKWFSPAGCSLMLSHIDLTLENELMSFYNFERCLLIKRNYYRNKRIVFYHNSFAMYTWNFSK